MSHSAPPAQHRSRLELAGGIAALALAIVCGIFALSALAHPKGRESVKAGVIPSSSASHAAPSSAGAKRPAASGSTGSGQNQTRGSSRPAVLVLNNSTDPRKTATAIQRLAAGGWSASNGGSFSGSILSTAVYYDPSVAGAQSAATSLQAQFPSVQRVKQKFDGLPPGPLILILTSDYS